MRFTTSDSSAGRYIWTNMGKLDRHSVESHGYDLCSLVAQAQAGANRELRELARRRYFAVASANLAPFEYAPAPGLAQRSIPAADFHRPCVLTLEALELTLYGYCVHRSFYWDRSREP